MFKKIKKSVAVFVALLLMSSGLSANIATYYDCYDWAFDAMDDAYEMGFSERDIGIIGELTYCQCASNCYLE